ncbi:MAG: CPBP family intramembrane metalloprotease [Planctomycetia bacterium]|nr:CPBP family intramembrane metalloprotease [Planctomycetia bacterium]
MNATILLAVILCGIAALWLAQTLLLICAREPWCVGPLRHRSEKPLVRWGMKLALQGVLLGVLFGYPATISEHPLDYHRSRLHPANWGLFAGILLSAFLCLCPMFALNVLVGWVKFTPPRNPAKAMKRVARCLVTALPLAFVEEAVFRGVLLNSLLLTMTGRSGMVAAIVLSSAIFASVHFFRPQKRLLLPAFGLFGLGVILGSAYLIGGSSYWLPVAIHAGGVVFIQVLRPFVEYKGPPWLVGYSSYPICGLFGVTSMALYLGGLAYAINAGMIA